MKPAFKLLLIAEFVIAFLPVTYLWILSLVALPASIMLLITGGEGGFTAVFLTVSGGVGLYGIVQLLMKLVNSNQYISKPSHIIIYLLFGLCSLCVAAIVSRVNEPIGFVMFILPSLVTLHFVYIDRFQ